MNREGKNPQPGPTVQQLQVDGENAGQRLDNFLISRLKGVPKSRVYRIIRKGEVRINGRRAKPQARLSAGDTVRVPPIRMVSKPAPAVGHFQDPDTLILFENDDLLVVNKPPGMAVHGGSGISAGVIESLRHIRPEGRRLELVHRLDRGTSGCLMVAKRRRYLKLLQDGLRRAGMIRKTYLALVHGQWPAALDRVGEPILTVSRAGQEKMSRVSGSGRSATTLFEPLACDGVLTLLRASPLTGRTHQIRVHARWARHPLAGDDRYGDELLDRSAGLSTRLMLHAAELEIPRLEDFPSLHIMAPLPVDDEFQVQVDSRFEGVNLFKTNR